MGVAGGAQRVSQAADRGEVPGRGDGDRARFEIQRRVWSVLADGLPQERARVVVVFVVVVVSAVAIARAERGVDVPRRRRARDAVRAEGVQHASAVLRERARRGRQRRVDPLAVRARASRQERVHGGVWFWSDD